MQFIQGNHREQSLLFPQSLDQIIDQDNEVRIIDLFVESINPEDYKFIIKKTKEGRPAYHLKDLLKLFVYSYLNHIRSSRLLEKECKRNIELMWLMKQLTPYHNTISDFRRDNEKRKIILVAKPLGRPSLAVDNHIRQGERNPIEGKIGQPKTAYGMNRIKARLSATSESWIASIVLVLNLIKLIGRAPESLFIKLYEKYIALQKIYLNYLEISISKKN